MKHGSLFSGVGGFDLAAQQIGWENVFHVEKDPKAREVLKNRFPNSKSYEDIYDTHGDIFGEPFYITQKGLIVGAKRLEKYDDCVALYNSGLSIQDCAEYYGITRQAMHKVLKRRGCEFRSNKKYGSDNHFYRGSEVSPKKKRVQHLTEKAVKKGVLVNPGLCSKCGCENTFKDGRSGIQAHHCDYDKPLDVIWLCQKCHHEWHKNNKAKNETEKNESGSRPIDIVSGGFPC